MHRIDIKYKNMDCVFNQVMTKKNNFVWLDNVYDLAVSELQQQYILFNKTFGFVVKNVIKLEFYNFVKFYVKFNIIIKSNNVNCSNILNRFNNEKINLLILFVFYAQNKCYNCLSNCSLQQSAFVKRYFISLLNNFSPNCK